MANTSTSKALERIVTQVQRTPGWTVTRQRGGSGVTVLAPGGDLLHFNSRGRGGRKLDNVEAELRRAGWQPDAAESARAQIARQRIRDDRARADSAIETAQREGQRRAHATALQQAHAELEGASAQVRGAELNLAAAQRRCTAAKARIAKLESERPA
ncbi:hypothetical protein KV557_24670 [Kitasatospora aureofaciens]|uniref:hypothetical protein n=1 Tax=Kitasatospora aureofaciens TaxID=1894 RepID=UPI001C4657C2|nr:hypothetical protein [Kitasatospora aureofaciens]MBV6700259.1 hypothetical protein [Kitasatospora aureofaciens]